jgi:hypothetical protein
MAIINKGTAFSNGEQLSASKLNALIDDATLGTESVDNSSTLLNASGAITVRDSGITAAKLATGAVTTAKILDANVTTAKIADSNVTFAKLTDVIDDDTMATATDTTLATSESIKSYVDSLLPIKAHCVWDGALTGTNNPISGFGVTSVTRNSTGSWTINLSVTAPTAIFTVLTSADPVSNGSVNYSTGGLSLTPTTVQIRRERSDGAAHDTNQISFAAIW